MYEINGVVGARWIRKIAATIYSKGTLSHKSRGFCIYKGVFQEKLSENNVIYNSKEASLL